MIKKYIQMLKQFFLFPFKALPLLKRIERDTKLNQDLLRALLHFVLLKEVLPELAEKLAPKLHVEPEELDKITTYYGINAVASTISHAHCQLISGITQNSLELSKERIYELFRHAVQYGGQKPAIAYARFIWNLRALSATPEDEQLLQATSADYVTLQHITGHGSEHGELRRSFLISIATLLRAGKISEAQHAIERCISAYGKDSLAASPFVAKYAFDNGVTSPLIAVSAMICDNVHANTENSTLKKFISNRSVGIVGNGPQAIGKKQGHTIDLYDVVVRFASFNTSDRFKEDYGSRTDIWGRNLGYMQKKYPPSSTAGIKFILYTEVLDSLSLAPQELMDLQYNIERNNMQVIFPTQEQRHTLLQACGCSFVPTTGALAVCWIKSINSHLSINDLFAFSFTDATQDAQWDKVFHYDHKIQTATPHIHNLLLEKNFIESLFKQHG